MPKKVKGLETTLQKENRIRVFTRVEEGQSDLHPQISREERTDILRGPRKQNQDQEVEILADRF